MEVIAFTKEQDFVRIGKDSKNAYWYGTSNVIEITKKLKRGDKVKFTWDKNAEGKAFLKTIEKIGDAPANTGLNTGSTETAKEASTGSESKSSQSESHYEDRNTTIRSQAIGKMVGAALISLQGQVDTNNICSIIDTLYAKFDSVIQ